jgi:hypothetical protein
MMIGCNSFSNELILRAKLTYGRRAAVCQAAGDEKEKQGNGKESGLLLTPSEKIKNQEQT